MKEILYNYDNLKLEDIDEYKQPDLSTNELHPKTK